MGFGAVLDRSGPKAASAPDLVRIRESRRPAGRSGSLASGTGPKAVFPAGAIGTERFDEPALSLGDKNRLSAVAAEGEVGRLLAVTGNLADQFSPRGQHRDGPLQYPRREQISGGVGAQAVDVKIVEPLYEFGGNKPRAFDPVRPDLPGIGFADIKGFSVRTEIDPVGRAHSAIRGHLVADDAAAGRSLHPPDLAAVPFPVWVARIDGAVGRDRHVIRLIEVVRMEVGFDIFSIQADQKDRVLLVVGDEHASFPIEADRV